VLPLSISVPCNRFYFQATANVQSFQQFRFDDDDNDHFDTTVAEFQLKNIGAPARQNTINRLEISLDIKISLSNNLHACF
jgi:hypothetical protein